MQQAWPREPVGQELEGLTQLFKALSDASRVKILFQIGISEACVRDVADKLKLSESAVSHHLHILRMNGLVRRHRAGKSIFYQLQDDHVRSILAQGCQHIEESFRAKSAMQRQAKAERGRIPPT